VRAIANLGLLREWIGRPGTGLMPIRGHSGVQGGAEMGCYATAFPGGAAVDAESARKLGSLWGFDVPAEPGLTTVEALDEALEGRIDGFYCIGGNFLETLPDPARIERALARIPLRVHSDIVVTSQMLVDPQETVYLLPARTRYEQRGGGTETTTERRVVYSPFIPRSRDRRGEERVGDAPRLRPRREAGRLRQGHFENAEEIRSRSSRRCPLPRDRRPREAGRPVPVGRRALCEGRRFPTADGKARFRPVTPPASRRATGRSSSRRAAASSSTRWCSAAAIR
jgi:hypothetical protein